MYDIKAQMDNLLQAIRAAKAKDGKTNAQLADETGVPISYVNKYLSGAPVTPNLEYIAALCAALCVPMGAAMGIYPEMENAEDADTERLREELAHKEEMLQERSKQVDLLQERSDLMVAELERKEADMKSVRASWKPVVYGLTGLCILLASVLMVYMVLDASRPDVGLIRADGTSPVIYGAILAVVLLCLFIGHTFVKKRTERKKNADHTN